MFKCVFVTLWGKFTLYKYLACWIITVWFITKVNLFKHPKIDLQEIAMDIGPRDFVPRLNYVNYAHHAVPPVFLLDILTWQ